MKKYFFPLAGVAALLLCALACTRPAPQKPRCLWIEAAANFPYYGDDPDRIAEDCRLIAASGFTDIMVDVRPTNGDVLFASSVAPALTRIALWNEGSLYFRERTADFDYLQAFIEAGHAAGLKVHAAVNVMVGGFWCPAGTAGLLYADLSLRDWATVDNTPDGLVNQLDNPAVLGGRFLDPAHPGVQDFLVTLLGELAAYEQLDGIVLDRCRYDDYALDAGYTEAAYQAFSAYLGHAPERWPVFEKQGQIFLEAEPDALETSWLTFRCQVIHDLVARIGETVHAVNPRLKLGVYVGAWFSEYYRSGVNWTHPRYDLAQEEPTYAWATPAYQATGFADLVDYLLLGAYTGADAVHGEGEWSMEGFARLGRQRLMDQVPFACGPDMGNGAGFEHGGREDVIPDLCETLLREADGLFVFDLCHLRRFGYWDAFRQALVTSDGTNETASQEPPRRLLRKSRHSSWKCRPGD